MIEGQLRESILVADCGSVNTRVALLDVVGGRYRFIASGIARSTGEPPNSNVTIGLLQAIREIETVTARTILSERGRLILPSQGAVTGVDMFVATTSAAPPIRAILVGLMDDVSLASAQRVALSTYTTILDVFGLSDSRPESRQMQEIVALNPEVLIITGGTDGGAADRVLRLTQTVGLALKLFDAHLNPPRVIYAGNADLRPAVAEILGNAQWSATDNVRPRVDIEYLDSAQAELNTIYEERKLFSLPGAEELGELADGSLIPTARAFSWMIHYLGVVLRNNVVGVDVGSASVTMASVIDKHPQLTVRSDLGVGHNLARIFEHVETQKILRWLPNGVSASDLQDFVANKMLFPQTVPMTSEDLQLELALARELIRIVLSSFLPAYSRDAEEVLPPVEMILASGAVLANVPRPGQAALVLLDALQPVGICSLALDAQGLAASLGAVARIKPMATVQVIEAGAFQELGNVVIPTGEANEGEVILQLKMIYENGSELEVEVEFGSLEVLPLPAGHSAELQLRPQRRFDIGAGPGRNWRRRVYGGSVGLIVDARGRPIRMPADPGERESKVQQWLWDMGG